MMQTFAGDDANALYDIIICDGSRFTVMMPKPKDSAQWMLNFEELPTKVKRGQSLGNKMMAFFFGTTGHYVTIVLEEKKTVIAGWCTNDCLPFILGKSRENNLAVGFSFIMTTPHHIPTDKQLTSLGHTKTQSKRSPSASG
ncbi:hypothetical protein EVAR_28751_1 [Eumeta japonica]|uniref:Uncharacterized protein n=1 Tax=Eumeta variegata TaxID=151549 RepID=A0A4C1Z363_EUMVA|nr:hypothetical protein EVAR_28751_1 [Eumeta japonica]